MDITAHPSVLSGSVPVPGSKSHTIRACIFASFAAGHSVIHNPLKSADCLSAVSCLRVMGSEIDASQADWIIKGGGLGLPSDVLNVGNSGSCLYFLAPIAATFAGWSILTGDASIRSRPVLHAAEALSQLGAEAFVSRPGTNAPPLLIKGPIAPGRIITDGRLSQYVSGLMMAASLMDGTTEIELTDPKETPYLGMTVDWLASLGLPVEVEGNYRRIRIRGPHTFPTLDYTVPADWESAAFPLAAAILTQSEISIPDIDTSDTQGDRVIVDILRQLGAELEITAAGSLRVGRTQGPLRIPSGEMSVSCADIPDALPILSVIACMTEGTLHLTDALVCRQKETDRIAVMQAELSALGADIRAGSDSLSIRGHSPLLADGSANPAFSLHGGVCSSHDDHRVAMSLAVLGLALKEGLTIHHAECASVSFPEFYTTMEAAGAHFEAHS